MTVTVSKWSNVQVAMQSALGTEVQITAVTKANPAVATVGSPSGGYNAADYVLISATGMYQIDGRVFRVASPTASTFAFEGEDSTLYDTFSAGTAKLITFGTTLATATGLTASGGDFDFLDITTIHDNIRKQIPGLAAPATYTFENLWDPSDSALAALKLASDNQAQRCIRFTFAGGQKVVFNGYVGATLLPTGNAQEVVKTPVAVTMFGRPTVYSS
jgi:hypothetical protein